jgi:hypothetical protein
MDIAKIPMQELLDDLAESVDDIRVCQMALSQGITQYSGGEVQRRLDVNLGIKEKIEKEILRRNQK